MNARLITENGFSIVSTAEAVPITAPEKRAQSFLVRDPYGYELDITVEIDHSVAQEILQRNGSLSDDAWASLLERHLAAYLKENGDYPPDARLIVNQFTADHLNQDL